MPWSVAGFVALGYLTGTLVGMSASPVTGALVGLLFAFAGGSGVAFFKTLTPEERVSAGQGIMALSLGCLLGVYSGIVVSEFRLLSPRGTQPGLTAQQPTAARQPTTGVSQPTQLNQPIQSPSQPTPTFSQPALVPGAMALAGQPQTIGGKPYLRRSLSAKVYAIDRELANNHLKVEAAYRQLHDHALEIEQDAGKIETQRRERKLAPERAYKELLALLVAEPER